MAHKRVELISVYVPQEFAGGGRRYFEIAQATQKFVPMSIAQVKAAIEAQQPVFSKALSSQEFYSGLDELLAFLASLDKSGIRYRLTSNGEPVQKVHLEKIAQDLSQMKLSDFR